MRIYFRDEARPALKAVGYHVRTAVLLVDGAQSIEEAHRRLERARRRA